MRCCLQHSFQLLRFYTALAVLVLAIVSVLYSSMSSQTSESAARKRGLRRASPSLDAAVLLTNARHGNAAL